MFEILPNLSDYRIGMWLRPLSSLKARLWSESFEIQEHLQRVEKAEAYIRKLLTLPESTNLRVRFLSQNRAAVGKLVGLQSADLIPLCRSGPEHISPSSVQFGKDSVRIDAIGLCFRRTPNI
uniref:AlNc14C229G9270 protein n=1 Tax=Albugo laibachii Nc14 TaxID=890382 RepID=F0WSD0_9STRA|nr:AlNc14C229G9270 [Albugo laibachii Nc14]CCA25887.1 AlNc14C329G10674 [Albugo laibachii Nc14]|eukprot:CCA25887.1 AlNc14C329G10674 [Albugo laibachii Nc14]